MTEKATQKCNQISCSSLSRPSPLLSQPKEYLLLPTTRNNPFSSHCYRSNYSFLFAYLPIPHNENIMPVAEIFLSAFIQVLFDKLVSGDILKFCRREGIHAQFKKWKTKLLKIPENTQTELCIVPVSAPTGATTSRTSVNLGATSTPLGVQPPAKKEQSRKRPAPEASSVSASLSSFPHEVPEVTDHNAFLAYSQEPRADREFVQQDFEDVDALGARLESLHEEGLDSELHGDERVILEPVPQSSDTALATPRSSWGVPKAPNCTHPRTKRPRLQQEESIDVVMLDESPAAQERGVDIPSYPLDLVSHLGNQAQVEASTGRVIDHDRNEELDEGMDEEIEVENKDEVSTGNASPNDTTTMAVGTLAQLSWPITPQGRDLAEADLGQVPPPFTFKTNFFTSELVIIQQETSTPVVPQRAWNGVMLTEAQIDLVKGLFKRKPDLVNNPHITTNIYKVVGLNVICQIVKLLDTHSARTLPQSSLARIKALMQDLARFEYDLSCLHNIVKRAEPFVGSASRVTLLEQERQQLSAAKVQLVVKSQRIAQEEALVTEAERALVAKEEAFRAEIDTLGGLGAVDQKLIEGLDLES